MADDGIVGPLAALDLLVRPTSQPHPDAVETHGIVSMETSISRTRICTGSFDHGDGDSNFICTNILGGWQMSQITRRQAYVEQQMASVEQQMRADASRCQQMAAIR